MQKPRRQSGTRWDFVNVSHRLGGAYVYVLVFIIVRYDAGLAYI